MAGTKIGDATLRSTLKGTENIPITDNDLPVGRTRASDLKKYIAPDLTEYAKKSDIPDVDGLLSKTDADSYYQPKGTYLTEVPPEYVTDEKLNAKAFETKADAQKTYATKEELGNKQDNLVSGTNIKTVNGQSILGAGNIEISGGGEGGGIADAPSDGNLYGRKNANWEQIIIPDTSTLATKEELASKANASDLSNYLTTANAESTYATKTALEGKLDTSTYTSDKSSFALKSEIPDTSNLATKEEVGAKQDALVSGANIKTVNGHSILGEGNIQIETPEGGISDAPQDSKTYGRNNGAWVEVTSPDLSGYAEKTGAEFTGTIAAPIVAFMRESKGMMAAIQADSNNILFRTYNAGVDSITFQVQSSIPLKLTEAGIWENNQLLENKYAKITDLDDLATKTEVQTKLDTSTYNSDKAGFETTEHATATYQPKGDYALKSEIPNTSRLATKTELQSVKDITDRYIYDEVTSLANIPSTHAYLRATLSSNQSLSLDTPTDWPNCSEVYIFAKNTASSDITVTIPNSNGYINMSAETLTIPAGKGAEISIFKTNQQVWIRHAVSEMEIDISAALPL